MQRTQAPEAATPTLRFGDMQVGNIVQFHAAGPAMVGVSFDETDPRNVMVSCRFLTSHGAIALCRLPHAARTRLASALA